jgi:hypothetical protein
MKALLVDTNFSAKPIYDYLVKQDIETFVIGGRPEDFLAQYTKNYINMNYSYIYNVQDKIGELGIDYVVPGVNDLSYAMCAQFSKTGIDTPATTECINNKGKFKDVCRRLGLPTPQVFEYPKRVRVPLIVKPVDSFSGRGMTIVRKSNEIPFAVAKAIKYSLSKNVVIEEYIEGQLYSYSAFIEKGEVSHGFFVEEDCILTPFTVDTSRVVHDFPKPIRRQIRMAINHLAQSLKLVDGLIHTQFILKGDKWWIIEIMRKCPGDLYSKLIEYSTGYNYTAAYVATFIDRNIEPLGISLATKWPRWILRHTIVKDSGRVVVFFERDTETELNRLYDQITKKELYTLGD